MFLVSSPKPIDPQLQEFVQQIEKQSPAGISVLAGRQFRYCLEQISVEVTISEPRKFNILEEFILRAGMEMELTTTENELAQALGLDPIFVQNTANTLRSLETLAWTPDARIILTPQGKQFYLEGSVPQPPQTKQIYAISDPLQGNLFFLSSALEEVQIELPIFEDFITIENRCQEISELGLEELQRIIQASGLGLHVPEDGKIITAANFTKETQAIWQSVAIFVIFDALEDAVKLQVRRGKQILHYASDLLDILQTEGKVSLQNLLYLSDETIAAEREELLDRRNQEVEARIKKIEQQAIETVKELRETGEQVASKGSQEKDQVILLRDSQIRQSFLETLRGGNHQVLIYSPWVSKEVVDNEFIQLLQNLANRGVWILIGHGISRRQQDETRPIPPQVEQKLREIKTREGLSAVQIFWLGNSHAKEVVVDRKIHLCGSHNWLSYRGDKLPRGETVYKVTATDKVEEAYEFLAVRFKDYARELWESAVQNRDANLAETSLCTWGALGMEEMALNELQLANWLELFPVWLKVVCQGLRSKKISPDSAYLATAVSMVSQFSVDDSNIELLRSNLRQLIGAIAALDRRQALKLLNEQIWLEFRRLGIAESALVKPDDFLFRYKEPDRPQTKSGKKASPKKNKGK
ncbi:MAG: hypothetical protein EAZ78_27035 [Oscillatoriales cyanobacterium]|uniref:PLD phosphodiesterase domain-containing protein n=1 Tax=Microcoleus anatoxicus PTRS2 TaxID=2705321 RepID=A0ABU8YS20_9CYAN|nr:MAG: hypothetical protein EA000_05870 [Oscillatoriales cyanobacterium]TAE96346.1 MAG: hypothetical protein EAZ78_27035 [Oscillatoriales cyanobacterium]TAF30306.1 MAG: hypothetical protein EAZ68_23025 [Oscillatoriales cyanobacterium]TAF60434.1 MAG: hypothetical protein EAZ59_26605 [Oscillatoriales cyanobacterium]